MRKRSIRQDAWAQTGLKAVGRAALTKYNREVRPYRPRCDAMRKRDGERCENIASPSGKCRVHGGATPRGDEWHKSQWPNGNAPEWQRRLNDKLKRAERDKRRKERCLAAMTPQEREAHERWQRSHKAGSAVERARRRADRKASAEIRANLENAEARPVSPELAALQAERQRLEAERDRFLKSIEDEQGMGVFG